MERSVVRSAKPISSAWDKVNSTLFLKMHKTLSEDKHAKSSGLLLAEHFHTWPLRQCFIFGSQAGRDHLRK